MKMEGTLFTKLSVAEGRENAVFKQWEGEVRGRVGQGVERGR